MSINSLIEYILFFSILDSFIISFKNTFAFGIKNISCKYPNPKNEAQMKDVLYRIKSALKKNGLMYASWKYGQGEKVDSLRYYVDFDEYAIKKILSIVSIEIQSIWITEDKLLRGCKWLNVIGKSV